MKLSDSSKNGRFHGEIWNFLKQMSSWFGKVSHEQGFVVSTEMAQLKATQTAREIHIMNSKTNRGDQNSNHQNNH